jgi:hypothetical protein
MEKVINKGGRVTDNTAIFFSLPSRRNPSWFLAAEKFGHLATAVLVANSEYLSSAHYFQLHLNASFYASLKREHGINRDEYLEVVNYCADELLLYDRYLLNNQILFSVELLRNFHRSGYFKNRKFKADHIINGVNFLRKTEEPLSLVEHFEYIMGNIDEFTTYKEKAEEIDEELPF